MSWLSRERWPEHLTTFRLLLGPVLLASSFFGEHPRFFLFALVAGLLSDIFDGILARRFGVATDALRAYDSRVKHAFDRLVPVLQRISALQHAEDFIPRAQELARRELGFALPLPVLERAWVTQLDMRTLFAWSVFETYEHTSASFFEEDPLGGQPGSASAQEFDAFLLSCGFHLLDITPCADGRLAHAIAYALRIPFSSVRRRSHAEIGRAHV